MQKCGRLLTQPRVFLRSPRHGGRLAMDGRLIGEACRCSRYHHIPMLDERGPQRHWMHASPAMRPHLTADGQVQTPTPSDDQKSASDDQSSAPAGSPRVGAADILKASKVKRFEERADFDPFRTFAEPKPVPQSQVPKSFDRVAFSKRVKRSAYLRRVAARKRRLVHLMRYSREHVDDWRKILFTLDSISWEEAGAYAKRSEYVIFASRSWVMFQGDVAESILEISERTGCHVQISEWHEIHTSAFRTLYLYGTWDQNTRAMSMLPAMTISYTEAELDYVEPTAADAPLIPETSKPYPESTCGLGNDPAQVESKAQSGVPRAVWTSFDQQSRRDILGRGNLSLALTRTIRMIIHPPSGNVDYETSRPQKPARSGKHIDEATQKLVDLLSPPKIVGLLTPEALTTALHFLLTHSKHSTAWSVLRTLEGNGYNFTVEPFEELCTFAAKQESIPHFLHAVQMMTMLDIKTSARIWARFFALMVRRYHSRFAALDDIIALQKHMDARGVTKHLATALEIEEYAIEIHLAIALRHPKSSILEFIQKKDAEANNLKWMTRSTLNRMVHFLCSRNRMEDAFCALEIFRSRGGRVGPDTLNTFLSAAAKASDAASAFAILDRFATHDVGRLVRLDGLSYALLMAIVWRKRYLNLFRVLWRYACMAGCVDRKFKRRVFASLIAWTPRPQEGKSITSKALWRARVGKFCVGIRQGLTRSLDARQLNLNDAIPQRDPLPQRKSQQAFKDIITLVKQLPPKDGVTSDSQEQREMRLRNLRDEDEQEMGSLRPTYPLVFLLKKAWQKDLDWQEQGLDLPSSLKCDDSRFIEMLKHGIELPVAVGDGTERTSHATALWAYQEHDIKAWQKRSKAKGRQIIKQPPATSDRPLVEHDVKAWQQRSRSKDRQLVEQPAAISGRPPVRRHCILRPLVRRHWSTTGGWKGRELDTNSTEASREPLVRRHWSGTDRCQSLEAGYKIYSV